ncbi:MAG TPA: alpha/beta fold hydrolase, partial [Kofleriaceae bacterium]|nr:alpha/beta fold hydrolase [Kofleriaceae bacterium]
EHADVVLVDQRGTGGSGALSCPVSFSDPLRPVLDLEVVRACRDRLSARADLASYSTAAAVADLDAVRAALGHDRIDIIGLSYGTRVAQEYLRAHPDRVRAVVLLGTVSPADRLPLPFAHNAHQVLVRLAQECAADVACHRAVPDMLADVAAVRATLATGKVEVALAGDRVATLEAGPFWEAVRAQLVTASSQRRLPWLLHEAALGRFAPIVVASGRTAGPDLAANGLLLSVSCPEDTLHIAAAELGAADQTVFGAYRVRQQLAACEAWGLPAVPRGGFVDSDAPVLLLAGGMDHVTPVRAAEEVAAHLPRSRVVVVPALGHFPEGLSGMECYERVIHGFLVAGDAADLDLQCLQAMQPPPFQTQPSR